MTMHFVVNNRASGAQRGVTHDSAMRFLDQMAEPDLTGDQIMAAYNLLYRDSVLVQASAGRRLSLSAGQPDATHIVTLGGKRIARAEIERLLSVQASASFRQQPEFDVRDGVTYLPRRS